MDFLSRLFGSGSKATKTVAPIRDVAGLVAPAVLPAVHAVLTPKICSSWFLGSPQLHTGVPWPEKDGRRLAFLACIDLTEVAAAEPIPWLPKTGSLSFFYDMDNQPWGFDPKDRGSWAVIYQTQPLTPQTEPFKSRNMAFRAIRSLPTTERTALKSLALTESEEDRLGELRDAPFGEEPAHQIGGFPNPVQGDSMELEAQLASNGIYLGDGKGYETPLAKSLESEALSWKLLFQIGSDDRLDFMWGDGGMLYFWVREEDARAGRFDQTWLILQCY